MTFFDRLRNVSKKLIDKYGVDVTYLRHINPSPVDPNKPWILGDTTVTEIPKVKFVFIPISKNNSESVYYEYKTDTVSGKMWGYCYGLGFEPSLKDAISRNGEILNIEAIITTDPDLSGTIIHKIRFKK